MNAPHVFRFDDGTEQDQYRTAISTIIGDIQKAAGLDLCLIADAINVSSETILNAYNKRTSLGAMYLARLGKVFGGGFLDPYHALYDIQAAPREPKPTADVLPVFCRVSTLIAEARDPSGPGGAAEVPQERSRYLPHLKAAVREGAHLAAQIEGALA